MTTDVDIVWANKNIHDDTWNILSGFALEWYCSFLTYKAEWCLTLSMMYYCIEEILSAIFIGIYIFWGYKYLEAEVRY